MSTRSHLVVLHSRAAIDSLARFLGAADVHVSYAPSQQTLSG
jgi:hypothetical protein